MQPKEQPPKNPSQLWYKDGSCQFKTNEHWCMVTLNDYILRVHQHEIGVSDPEGTPITARSCSTYVFTHHIPSDFEQSYREKQIVEVGAGLAEFSPHMAHIASKPPIVIDPTDYHTIKAMLITAQTHGAPPEQIPIIATLIHRIETLLDPSKVTLYNMSVIDAVKQYPKELRGIADVVIDVFGAVQYVKPWSAKLVVDVIEQDFLPKRNAIKRP